SSPVLLHRTSTLFPYTTLFRSCAANAMLLCFGDGSTPANGLNGVQLANPFEPGAVLGELDRTTTHSTTTGVSLQATNTDQLFGQDRKSTRLNSSHVKISYAVFC